MKIALSDYVRGAAVATRLVNTSASVRREGGEELTSATALGRFLHELGVGPAGQPTAHDLRQVLALREQVAALIAAPDEARVVTGSNELLGRAAPVPELAPDSEGRWQWHLEPARGASPADVLALLTGVGLLGVVRTLGYARLRSCEAPDCAGMFVDTSRAGRRRFCTPELCGNRLNVANHRARRRAGGAR